MPTPVTIPRRSPSILARRTGDEYVLVPVTDNIADMTCMYTLNETGAFIWDLIDGQKSTLEIAASLAAEYDVPEELAIEDVDTYLSALRDYLITE